MQGISKHVATLLAISAVAALSTAASAGQSVKATFIIRNAGVTAGQKVYVVGDQPQLGKWSPAHGFPMTAHGRTKNAWIATISLPGGTSVQYKYVKWDGKKASWEADEPTTSKNREVTLPKSGQVTLDDNLFKPQ